MSAVPSYAQERDDYQAFLEAKIKVAPSLGISCDLESVNPALKPFNRVMVPWLVEGGRRALFASFGLHKTATQIEVMRQIRRRVGGEQLIVLPLNVRTEFRLEQEARFSEGEHQVGVKFIQSDREMDGGDHIYLTNYETVREGKLDPSLFVASSLDEASILRGFGSTKTFREFMRLFDPVRFRFVATATPSPNAYIEILAYAAYLGIMDVGEAKTRFFKRDSEKADNLVLHAHKEHEFWLWVASWALFVETPSDLGFSDEGYVLPELDIRWHMLPSDHRAAGTERDGQGRLLNDAAVSLPAAAKEKRSSLSVRIDKMLELRADAPDAHRIIWHDLEAEREAIEKAIPGVTSVYGSQGLNERETAIIGFSDGHIPELAAKPVMLGSGCNLQRHCHWHLFLGIGHKFNDFIQAIHRLRRFGQPSSFVRLDLIYTEAERGTRENLEAKWRRHEEQRRIMSGIIRKYGLSQAAMAGALQRSIGVERQEEAGRMWRAVNSDCVEETRRMEADSVDLIITSIPFATQYEYTPSYNDFGHTDDNAHFWAQMDFLSRELLRILKPGRDAFIHVKDRIVPGGLTGLGFQTVQPFHAEAIDHFKRHGLAYLGMKTIATDVVRENNQTYRLGWTEQCKDGTRMGPGMPEYLLMFRKPPTDRSDGYADEPVVKIKPLCDDHGEPAPFDPRTNWKKPVPGTGYSRARWQMDAHGFARSSGDRLLSTEELQHLPHDQLYKLFRDRSLAKVYDFEEHVAIAEELDHMERLPSTFMLFPPHSSNPDVWTDVTRMQTLNGAQAAKGREMHLCPLQFDIVDRVIVQCSQPGELVFDPFGGLMTVPFRAIKLGRRGAGVELNPRYFADGVRYLREAEAEAQTPTLFDLLGDAA